MEQGNGKSNYSQRKFWKWKTTVARALQKEFGSNTMLISQDVIRRDMLKVKDGEDTKACHL